MDQILDRVLKFDRFELDLKRGYLRMDGHDIELPPKRFEVLRHLAENAGRLVSKEELYEAVWPKVTVTDDSLVQCIRELRQKLGDDGHSLIKTVPRRGYLLDAVVTPTTRARGPAREESEMALPTGPSLAVLPFDNMSGDPNHDYFADGMTDEIITALSQCASLFVIARNSSFIYKGKRADVRQIGRELGVRYLLEGSVQRFGNRLRVTAQLVDTTSGVHIWADRFDGDAGEIFELQDRITASVAAAVEPKLQTAEIERLKHKPVSNLDAYDLMLRALSLEHECTQESSGSGASLSRTVACD